jgi:anti-sigma B factor antagonist
MGECRYSLRGEVDLATAPSLRDDLQGFVRPGTTLVVDCSELAFIDSQGIAVLFDTHRALEAAGGKLVIANIPQSARRPFDILGLRGMLADD